MKLGARSVWTLVIFLAIASKVGFSEEAIDVRMLIERVSDGEDYSGQKLLVSGVALNKASGSQQLINLGTGNDLRSSSIDNFVSVYDAPTTIKAGQAVTFRIFVEISTATRLGSDVLVTIEAAFLECVGC